MANDVEIKITADGSNAEAGIGKVKTGFQKMKDSIIKNRKAIGLGMVAMGAGIEVVAKKQQGLTDSTRKLANATGMGEKEIRDMATSLSNATFPLESALELMKLGAQQGLESADALKKYANFWDTVGDATGLSADALAKSGAALAAVGVEVGNESELLGAFGLITNESTSSVKDFLDGIARMAPEMADMGVSVDEAAVIMTAMERELGLTARTARTEFKEALEQSETGLAGVLEQLGLSEAQIATYQEKLGESTGVIQENADAHASTKTVMDKLKSSMSDLAFANGAVIEKASVLAPIFMAAGPIMAGFTTITGLMTPALHAAKLAFIGLNLSMGPIALIIIGIGLAIAAGFVIWKNWDKIMHVLRATLEFLKEKFKIVFEFIREIVKKVFTKITEIYNSKLGWLLPAGPLIKAILFLKNNWDEIWAGIQATFTTVTDALIGTFRSVKGTILGIWDGMVAGIKAGINTVVGAINKFIRGINAIKINVPRISLPFGRSVGGYSIGMPQIPEIPTLAKGGIVTKPTLAMIGESGPEAVVPLGRGGAGAGMTINLVINGDVNGMDDFEQKVTSVIRDAVLGGGFQGVLARA
jgi:predicted nucleic acid-binding protein